MNYIPNRVKISICSFKLIELVIIPISGIALSSSIIPAEDVYFGLENEFP